MKGSSSELISFRLVARPRLQNLRQSSSTLGHCSTTRCSQLSHNPQACATISLSSQRPLMGYGTLFRPQCRLLLWLSLLNDGRSWVSELSMDSLNRPVCPTICIISWLGHFVWSIFCATLFSGHLKDTLYYASYCHQCSSFRTTPASAKTSLPNIYNVATGFQAVHPVAALWILRSATCPLRNSPRASTDMRVVASRFLSHISPARLSWINSFTTRGLSGTVASQALCFSTFSRNVFALIYRHSRPSFGSLLTITLFLGVPTRVTSTHFDLW